jgi:hypothetical protein
MNIELIFILVLALGVLILLGVVLHMAKTIERLHQYIGELERDYRTANNQLMKYDNQTDNR